MSNNSVVLKFDMKTYDFATLRLFKYKKEWIRPTGLKIPEVL